MSVIENRVVEVNHCEHIGLCQLHWFVLRSEMIVTLDAYAAHLVKKGCCASLRSPVFTSEVSRVGVRWSEWVILPT